MKHLPYYAAVLTALLLISPDARASSLSNSGPDLPGTAQPGSHPTLLAPGFINTGLITRDVTMTPDGREIYFCQATGGYGYGVILVTKFDGHQWSAPAVAEFSGDPRWVDLEPHITPDGRQLFFYSSRPATAGDKEGAQDIWVVDRIPGGWSEPRNLGAPVNSPDPEFFPTVTEDGTLYFCRAHPETRVHTLYRSAFVGGTFQEPEELPVQANAGRNRFNAWMSPDHSRMIIPVAGHPDNLGGVDYWLTLRSDDDDWCGPFNLGPLVNDGSRGSWSPYVSPDEKTFFFMSGRTTGEDLAWPANWSTLQGGHNSPGHGRAGIFVMDAVFLDSVAKGVTPKADVEPQMTGKEKAEPGPAWPGPQGPYLGQDPPGLDPEIFARGLISTGLNERDIAISPDGRHIYFGLMDLGLVSVMVTHFENGRWTEPVTAGFHVDEEFACLEPTFSADGQSVFFLANQAAPGQEQGRGWANQNIFTSRKKDGQWSQPQAVPAPVTSTAAEYFPSLATDGTLYFSREDSLRQPYLWSAEPLENGFAQPSRLPETINIGTGSYNAFVAPDESFIITCVSGHPDNLGPSDYWISFADQQGQWQPAKNLGDAFNGPGLRASSAFLSPDGKYLFFSSSKAKEFEGEKLTREDLHAIHANAGNGAGDIWWVSSEVLNQFR